MNGEFVLDYRFDVRSPADEHHVRAVNEMMERAPNPIGLKCIPGNVPYSCQFRMRACGEIGMMECQLDSPAGSNTLFTSTRARSHIARNQFYGFNVSIWLGGNLALEAGGRAHSVRTGDFFVMDTEFPFHAHMPNQGHCFSFSLPSSWEAIGDIRLENAFGHVYPGQDRRRRILVDYVQHLRARSDALAAPDAARKLYDILALALNPRAKNEHQMGLLALIRNHIDTYCMNPDLDPVAVAAAFDISARYLRMLFAASNTTFTEYLTEQRLAQAQLMLADPRNQHQTIIRIALNCGFRDINHFGRRFRERYGMTPGEFRRASVGV
jgi:AraC-like DNA-binding protein